MRAESVKHIVITGGTRGIGFGMARDFMMRGHSVTICGQSQRSVANAVQALKDESADIQIFGYVCDVSDYVQAQALWASAYDAVGKVDIWINNAGISHPRKMAWDLPVETIDSVVDVNLLGMMYGTKIAIAGMLDQGFGQVYNMEGFGSGGRKQPGISVYGATKRALRYFTESVMDEVKGTVVQVGTISPGIVVTDLLIGDYEGADPAEFERAKRAFNILGDTVETVTPYLVEKVLENKKNGAKIAWLTTPKIILRFLQAPFQKRDLFVDIEQSS